MSQGYQIFTAGGAIQEDSEDVLFHMTNSGSAALASTAYGPGAIAFVNVVTSATYPIFAVSAAFPVSVFQVSNSGSSWTFGVVAPNGNSGSDFNWYLFDHAPAAANRVNYGIEVFDESGNLVRHTTLKPLRIVGELDTSGGSTSLSLDGSRTYASVTCKAGWNHTVIYLDGQSGTGGAPGTGQHSPSTGHTTSLGTALSSCRGVEISGGTIQLAGISMGSYLLYDHTEIETTELNDAQFLIVDVTGY